MKSNNGIHDEEKYKRLSEWYELFFDTLFAYGTKFISNRELIQDTIQDLFMELFDSSQDLAQIEHPKFYLLKALRFKLWKEKKKHSNTDDLFSIQDFSAENELIHRVEMDSEYLDKLTSALSKLSPKQKEVIHLKFYQNLSNKEISELIGIKYQSVNNLLFRTISALRMSMEKIL